MQGGVGIGSVQQWQAGESGSRESGSREWCERQLVLVSATVPRSVTETAAKWGWEPLVLVEGGGRAGVQEEQGERGLVAALEGTAAMSSTDAAGRGSEGQGEEAASERLAGGYTSKTASDADGAVGVTGGVSVRASLPPNLQHW